MTGSPEDTSNNVPIAIVVAVAEREGVVPEDLSPPLSTVVDTDALQRLVRTAGEGTTIVFEYRDWVVRVRGDGDVTLRPREPGA